jgi:Secretion system C-terminal sorting domain
MKKLFTFFLFGLLVTPLSIFAQDVHSAHPRPVCGTSMETQQFGLENTIELARRYPNFAAPRAVAYIPVWFHMVANSSGVGRTTEANVAEMLCEWNRIYSANGIEMQFYIKGFSKIDLDALYNGPQSFAGTNRMLTTKKTDAMNVYLVNNCGDGSEPPGTIILAYYLNRLSSSDVEYASDWVVCSNSQVNQGGASTIAHEAGHMFSLPHTFYGWEQAGAFDPIAPASPCAPASVNYNGRIVSVEKVARSGSSKNCDSSGDNFCDTPEDYLFGFSNGTRNCIYAGIAKDPECVAVNPDEKNIMSYFNDCVSTFSPQQKAAMVSNYLNNARRGYLRAGNITPSLGAATPVLVSPAAGATTPVFNNINLDWNDVPSAFGYSVEVSRFSSFAQVKSFYVTTSNLNINSLNTGGYLSSGFTYYWRIKAVVPYSNCANTTTGNFRTGTVNGVNDIDGVTQFLVSPNPLSKTQNLSLEMTTEKAFDANIKLVNMTGQVVQTEKRRFATGYSTQSISVVDLTNGTYILTVESEKGVLNKRIVIQ